MDKTLFLAVIPLLWLVLVIGLVLVVVKGKRHTKLRLKGFGVDLTLSSDSTPTERTSNEQTIRND